MTETPERKTYEPDDPQNPNNLVVRGSDGDPLPHPNAVRMVEIESYERVIEGLKASADACMHLAKNEPRDCETWKAVGLLLDKVRLEATKLSGGLTLRQNQTAPEVRGEPLGWRHARRRFLDGLKQATGGMRQLAVCFRSDVRWAMMASELERRQRAFEDLLRPEHRLFGRGPRRLILPAHYTRQ